jgi:pimeloyl-ACP methyl ester carboxylesterase
MKSGHKLSEIRLQASAERAIVFIHGFKGDVDDTWGLFPTLLGTEDSLRDWDILALGYNTSFLPGSRGIWSADPDLPILATQLRTRLLIAPLKSYRTIALVAHSMGGLVAQQALTEEPGVADRVSHLLLFGTPSNGLGKAAVLARMLGPLFGQQVHNMASGGAFITNLRTAWEKAFDTPPGKSPPFALYVVAGDRDQFVPPASSLGPFAHRFHYVVSGDHLAIVKPTDRRAESVQLVVAALATTSKAPPATPALRLAAENGMSQTIEPLVARTDVALSEPEVVQAALAFERDGNRTRAIQLLEEYTELGTDVQGALAGRIKRQWLQEGDDEDAAWAAELYRNALATAAARNDHEQAYYHAINLAFLALVKDDDADGARRFAAIALDHTAKSPREFWRVATEAEAGLYMGDYDRARDLYREAMTMGVPQWRLLSAGFQAQHVAAKLNEPAVSEMLRGVFDAEPPRRNRIFVSYSHGDRAAVADFRTMMAPLVKHNELEVWDDTRIEPGEKWDSEIRKALATCRVAVLLVSAEFLASDYVNNHELPALFLAADAHDIDLFWVLLSPALYEQTRLVDYPAAHDLRSPMESLEKVQSREVWKDIALKIKAAVFDGRAGGPQADGVTERR